VPAEQEINTTFGVLAFGIPGIKVQKVNSDWTPKHTVMEL
jgi:hypothetical protein